MTNKTSVCVITDKGISQFVNQDVCINNEPAGIIEDVEQDEDGVRATIKLSEVGSERVREMLLRIVND